MKINEIIKQIQEREIKFRAWDTQIKRMLYNVIPSPGGDGVMEFYPDGGFDELIGTHVIPLEYTGLKDKHGKEIYEGDILKVDYYGDCVVVFRGGAFWYVDKDKFKFPLFPMLTIKFCKVIGNIFETLELLGG